MSAANFLFENSESLGIGGMPAPAARPEPSPGISAAPIIQPAPEAPKPDVKKEEGKFIEVKS
jgi:hypothetical protein